MNSRTIINSIDRDIKFTTELGFANIKEWTLNLIARIAPLDSRNDIA